jgi:hypothetical protein
MCGKGLSVEYSEFAYDSSNEGVVADFNPQRNFIR